MSIDREAKLQGENDRLAKEKLSYEKQAVNYARKYQHLKDVLEDIQAHAGDRDYIEDQIDKALHEKVKGTGTCPYCGQTVETVDNCITIEHYMIGHCEAPAKTGNEGSGKKT